MPGPTSTSGVAFSTPALVSGSQGPVDARTLKVSGARPTESTRLRRSSHAGSSAACSGGSGSDCSLSRADRRFSRKASRSASLEPSPVRPMLMHCSAPTLADWRPRSRRSAITPAWSASTRGASHWPSHQLPCLPPSRACARERAPSSAAPGPKPGPKCAELICAASPRMNARGGFPAGDCRLCTGAKNEGRTTPSQLWRSSRQTASSGTPKSSRPCRTRVRTSPAPSRSHERPSGSAGPPRPASAAATSSASARVSRMCSVPRDSPVQLTR
mmetsp:Transcript_82414/g.254752  ORF Transcript_82414/g.254752 Transcript_82414/m.254752 type:complete len:272 (-) Transcript_82414:1027-1842(-)